MNFNRRVFLRTAATVSAATLASPAILTRARAGEPGAVRWLMAENTTGNWDPAANTTLANINCEYLAFDYLLLYPMAPGADPIAPVPSLATSFTVLDPFSVEMKIRQGVKFHDGADLTPEDVKASLEHYSKPGIARGFYPGPLSVTVKDPQTIVVSTKALSSPISSFLFLQAYNPILRAKDVEDGKALQAKMNGTGPYRFVGQQKDDIVFEANSRYWGKQPSIQRLAVRHVADGNARMLALLSGEAELIERLDPEQFVSLKQKTGVLVSKLQSVENRFLHFRNGVKPFDDWRVRRAAAAAIDREAILGIAGEAGYAADCPLVPMKLGYKSMPDYGKFDVAECQRLLVEAGYPHGKGMPNLEYLTSTGFYPKSKECCEAITAMLQEQGFPVTLTVLESAAWNERYYNPKAGHMIDGGWAAGTPEPNLQILLQYYSKIGLITGANDPTLDAAIEKEMAGTTLALRKAALQDTTLPTIADRMPNIVLFNSNLLHAMSSRLTGVRILPSAQIDFNSAALA
jgi:peptide/nickel transport system substrate-binding protein